MTLSLTESLISDKNFLDLCRSVNRGRLFINPDVTQVVDDLVKVIELNEFDSAYPVTMVDMSVATDEVQQCVDSLVTKVDEECRRHLRRQIVQWSIEAMQICIKRCNHCPHYKAYCTLASWYFANTVRKTPFPLGLL